MSSVVLNVCIIFTILTSLLPTEATHHITECSTVSTVGVTDPFPITANRDTTNNNAHIMVEDPYFQVKCCGVVSKWVLNARVLASVDLMVWRRESATEYRLIGINTVTPTSIIPLTRKTSHQLNIIYLDKSTYAFSKSRLEVEMMRTTAVLKSGCQFKGGRYGMTVYETTNRSTNKTQIKHIYRSPFGLQQWTVPIPQTTGDYEYNVPTADRITVMEGDYLGWYATGQQVISYNEDSTYPLMSRMLPSNSAAHAVGDIVDWSAVSLPGKNRLYAIGAETSKGDTPTLAISPNNPKTVDESTASGATVVSLSVVDDDTLDTHTINVLATENSYFEYDPADLTIKTTQALIPEGTYKMELEVIDDCGQSSTSTVTLTVQNRGISITNLPTTVFVDEDEFQQQNLYDLDITEVTDKWYCDMDDVNTAPFLIRQVDVVSGPEYAFYLNDWPQLDYDTRATYLMTVRCHDDEHTASGTVTVSIIKNQAPVFRNLDNATTIDATTAVNSDEIFGVDIWDDEMDQISFSMTTNPAGGPFDILDFSAGQAGKAGKVVLTSNVLRHHTSAAYDLYITASDGYNTVGPRTLTVNINNINDKPEITNLPASINIIENAALSTSLFTVTVDDLDTNDPRNFSATFDPADAVKYFTIDNNGVVKTSAVHNIDFDILSDVSIEMYIMVNDGKEHDEDVLAIQIQNLNERPSFSQTHYSVTRNEGVDGDQFPLTRYNIRDPDAGDTHTFSIDCGTNTSRILIHRTTGRISFNGDYDLDTEGTPTDFQCSINITDYDGLYDTCEMAINVRYVNDYTPSFPFASYPVTIHNYQVIGTIVLTLTATDLDLVKYGTFHYSLVQTFDGGAELFGVLKNGSIYIKDDLSTYYLGASFNVLMLATDTGGRVGTATVQVNIPQSTTGPPEGTTETPFRYHETTVNTALLSVCVLTGIAFILLTGYLLMMYFELPTCNQPDCCKPRQKPPKRPIPKKPTPVLPKPTNISPVDTLPLLKGVKLEGGGEERVAIHDNHPGQTNRSSGGERAHTANRKTESRDFNKWITDVSNSNMYSDVL